MLRYAPILLLALGCSTPDKNADPDAGPLPDLDAGDQLLCPSVLDSLLLPPPTDISVTGAEGWSSTFSDTDFRLTATNTGSDFTGPTLAWVKFSILLEAPETVVFQHTGDNPFHYDFLESRVDEFTGLSHDEFNAISLDNEGRRVLLGAIVLPLQSAQDRYGIQFASDEALPPALIEYAFGAVRGAVNLDSRSPVYLPAPSQEACATQEADWLGERGISLGDVDAWVVGNQCYSQGWSVGKLVKLPAAELEAASLDGRLSPNDILLLEDAAPEELPALNGVITLTPSTPNSHTAILAQSFGIPFAYLRDPDAQAKAESLVGKEIILGSSGGGLCAVDLWDLSPLSEGIRNTLRSMSEPEPLQYQAKVELGSIAIDLDDASRTQLSSLGGKSANYSVLRDTLPENSRPAIGLSMDLWNDFLNQEIASEGTSLAVAIDSRLSTISWPPPMAELDSKLGEIRDLFRDEAVFSPVQKTAILSALSRFDATQKLRFRSSTNVEDSANFTGAGLYASFSGCVADDTDADEVGPSQCNPSKADERGVFRAVQKVYASFFRRNAFVARLRRGVNEDEVGMAVLVHHSFPDEIEEANGVIIYRRASGDSLDIVSHPGATSVTNSDNSVHPEEVSVSHYSFGTYPELRRSSDLLPLGATVLEWDAGYIALTLLLKRVMDAMQVGVSSLSLDFEYKRITGEGIIVKQVRPFPLSTDVYDVAPLLAGGSQRLCISQAENSDVFAIHRLKSIWNITPRNIWMNQSALSEGFFTDLAMEYQQGGALSQVQGTPGNLADYTHDNIMYSGTPSSNEGFRTGDSRFTLIQSLPRAKGRMQAPVVDYQTLYPYLKRDHDIPVEFREWDGSNATRTEEIARLVAHCPDEFVPDASSIRQERTMTSGALTVQTAFYWPQSPGGPIAGYTAPLMGWDETTITGLTTTPIVLHSNWSQSTRPEHHNFGASYIFEPRLEPNLDASTLAELNSADIAAIFVTEGNLVQLIGLDGSLRDL